MGCAQRVQEQPSAARTASAHDGLSMVYPALPGSVPTARHAIADFAAALGTGPEQLDAIRLATTEAVANVVKHAYPDAAGDVHVNAWFAAGELWLLISDHGCGLRAGRQSDGLGQGLALIQQMADEMWIVDDASGGTEVRMRFELARHDGANHPRGSDASANRPASPRFSTTR